MIPNIKWYDRFNQVVFKISIDELIDKNAVELEIKDNIVDFKYKKYEFKQKLYLPIASYTHTIDTNLISICLLKSTQMDEWNYLVEDKIFNKS